MPTSAKYLGRGFRNVAGLKHLDRFAGSDQAAMQKFLYFEAWRDVVFAMDDFTGKAISSTLVWTTNAGTGATAFASPATLVQSGVVQAATGTDATAANRRVNMYGPPIYSGTKNAGMEVRFQLSAITAVEWEIGFLDTMTTITTPAPLASNIDTPTIAAGNNDAAVVAMDTSRTLTTMALVSSLATVGSKTNIGTLTPTAATDMTVRIQLIGTTVVATIDDATTNFTSVTIAPGITAATLVRPWIYVGNPTNTTTRTMNLDYVAVWQDR